MPHKKRKIFTKDNSVKFLLLHGHSQATNAEGETLQNEFVPVSNNYKPGSSLLMSSIAALCNAEGNGNTAGEPNLEKIMGQFNDDSESEDDRIECLPSKMKKLTIKNKEKRVKVLQDEDDEYSDDNSDYSDDNSIFSDVERDSFKEVVNYGQCPENLKIMNERFEKVLEEYDEDQIGALDDEEICGYLSPDCERVQNMIDSELNRKEEEIILSECDETIKEKILNYAEKNSEDEMIVEIVTERPLEFDCESILSTYSNKYNHPAVIKEENVKKIKIPYNPMRKMLTKSQLKTLESDKESDTESDDNLSINTKCNVRVKGETPEERRERKNLFKEAKRESRMLKKENKLAFKREKRVQTAQNINTQRNAGIKLL